MKFKDFSFALIVVFALTIFPQAKAFAGGTPEKRAAAAADAWLKLVDNGKYEESWEAAALMFRGGVDKGQWVRTAGAVRGPLGKVLLRKLKSKRFMTSLPGAPDGEYVVIQYETSFENKKAAVETVTPMLERDGKWRVSGYYIR